MNGLDGQSNLASIECAALRDLGAQPQPRALVVERRKRTAIRIRDQQVDGVAAHVDDRETIIHDA